MHDWVFDEHFQAFKICDSSNFSWKVISEKDLTEAELTIAHKLRDGFLYIEKRWM